MNSYNGNYILCFIILFIHFIKFVKRWISRNFDISNAWFSIYTWIEFYNVDGETIYVYIWQSDTMTKYTSDANVNIPHIDNKMPKMSSLDDWYYMYPKVVFNDNNLPCIKPIPTPCNSFAGNVCDIDIHSARARELGQQNVEVKTMNAANISDCSINCNTVLANAPPQQQMNSARRPTASNVL